MACTLHPLLSGIFPSMIVFQFFHNVFQHSFSQIPLSLQLSCSRISPSGCTFLDQLEVTLVVALLQLFVLLLLFLFSLLFLNILTVFSSCQVIFQPTTQLNSCHKVQNFMTLIHWVKVFLQGAIEKVPIQVNQYMQGKPSSQPFSRFK